VALRTKAAAAKATLARIAGGANFAQTALSLTTVTEAQLLCTELVVSASSAGVKRGAFRAETIDAVARLADVVDEASTAGIQFRQATPPGSSCLRAELVASTAHARVDLVALRAEAAAAETMPTRIAGRAHFTQTTLCLAPVPEGVDLLCAELGSLAPGAGIDGSALRTEEALTCARCACRV